MPQQYFSFVSNSVLYVKTYSIKHVIAMAQVHPLPIAIYWWAIRRKRWAFRRWAICRWANRRWAIRRWAKRRARSVLTLAAPAAQLLLCHAVLSSVSLTFSSKDAFVHFLILHGMPLLLFPSSFRECKSLLYYTYCFCMHVQRKPFFF